jgi:oligosaccharide repeat unit polymerase
VYRRWGRVLVKMRRCCDGEMRTAKGFVGVAVVREPKVPRVTPRDWFLGSCGLTVAAASFLFDGYAELVTFAWLLAILNCVWLGFLGKEAMQTRVVGKAMLVGGALWFFWLEALTLANGDPPFAVPAELPLSGQFAEELVHWGWLYVAIFQLMLMVGYAFRPRLKLLTGWVQSRVDRRSRLSLAAPYICAGCALLPILVAYQLNVDMSIEALLAARSGTRPKGQELGSIRYLYFVGMYGAALLLSDLLLFRQRRTRTWVAIVGATVLCFAMLPFVMGGTRHLLLFIALPSCIWAMRRAPQRFSLRRMWWLGGLGLILFAMQLQFVVRSVGWTEISSVSVVRILEGGTAGQFTALLFAESLVPASHDYFMEPTTPYFVLHWVPSAIWAEKPFMRAWEYYNDAYVGGGNFNVTPSVVGQFYINWGTWGVLFIGAWLGFLMYVADLLIVGIREQQRAIGVVVGMFYAFIAASFRFYSPIYLTYVVAGALVMFFITRRRTAEVRLRPIMGPASAGQDVRRRELLGIEGRR